MSDDKRLGTNPLSWVDPVVAADMHAQALSASPAPNVPAPATLDAVIPAFPAEPPAIFPSDVSADIPAESAAEAARDVIFTASHPSPEEDPMGKSKVKIKRTLNPGQVAAHLRDLADSLESGTIRAESGEESIVLGVADTVEFEMKVSRKKDTAKFSLEMEWPDDGTRSGDLKISNA